MKKMLLLLAPFLLYSYAMLAQISSGSAMHHGDTSHLMFNQMDLKWGDGPPSLPKGAKMAVLEGDPGKEGMFTLRAMIPPNYKIPPHWHPTTEHVTVIEGVFYMGLGEKFDESKATLLKQGGFASMPEKTVHYAFSKEQCIIQVHAMGPFAITYIDPADDPRKK